VVHRTMVYHGTAYHGILWYTVVQCTMVYHTTMVFFEQGYLTQCVIGHHN